ncbi:DUF2147 domain-containing protein [Ornithobacterium rhinotracheale]|uniref:DUF2147 domain-containing protein n=1 Tax=Ornithobacterium rhinotracheale TaxID=28251 RepID=UPI00129C9603|nr:DUF2147 domain-containing protein [Ornithobacterium rhinotracheale]MRJ09096.1 DUF2147 domain-containing protein [Ornithobacterium rhinotracheale]UOH78951.1 DUF2147 domain-containing protein [Ornithobacterium rhinotracheale]
MKKIVTLMLLTMVGFTFAQTPVGTWKILDEKTGAVRTHIKIYPKGNALHGKVVKIGDPKDINGICSECKGDKKNKRILGLEILTGLKKKGDTWVNGKIIDPQTGNVYSCKAEPMGKDKLKMRGYLGISLLGKTQIWERVD